MDPMKVAPKHTSHPAGAATQKCVIPSPAKLAGPRLAPDVSPAPDVPNAIPPSVQPAQSLKYLPPKLASRRPSSRVPRESSPDQ